MEFVRATVSGRVRFGGFGLGCALVLTVLWVLSPWPGRAPHPSLSVQPHDAASGPGAAPLGSPLPLADSDAVAAASVVTELPPSDGCPTVANPYDSAPPARGIGHRPTSVATSGGGTHPEVRSPTFPIQTSASSASNPLVVAAEATPPETDSTIPIQLSADVAGGVPPYDVTWASSVGGFGVGTDWSFVSATPGNFTVTAFVTDALGTAASDSRTVHVETLPNALLEANVSSSDVGTPLSVNLTIAGGVAPFTGTLQVEPGGPEVLLGFREAGGYTATVTTVCPGPAWGHLSLTDVVGGSVTVDARLGTVYPRPSINVTPAVDRVDAGMPMRLVAVVTGGAPPVGWTVLASVPLSNTSGVNGTVPATSAFAWYGEISQPGNASIYFHVADADGASAGATVSVGVAPFLAPELRIATPTPIAGGELALNVTVRGGVPPYVGTFSLSDGEATGWNLPLAGSWAWTATPRDVGNLTVLLQVSDALNRSANLTAVVAVGASSSEAPKIPPAGGASSLDTTGWIATVLTAVVVVSGLAGVVAVRWRRRAMSVVPSDDASGALGEVRELLRDSDGLDRETLGLLAQEAGLSRAATDQAVERWARDQAADLFILPSHREGISNALL
ncbi:MAG TPA: hypothetical protein VIZ68_01055, partial [Thermoplasmata archaeon]